LNVIYLHILHYHQPSVNQKEERTTSFLLCFIVDDII